MIRTPLALVLGLLAMGPALAEDDASDMFIAAETEETYLAKDYLIGAKVQNSEGKIIGDVEDVILEEGDDDDVVVGLIVGIGGFLGVGEKKIGVKYDAFEFTEKDGKNYVTLPLATKEALEAAKPFERSTAKKTLFERAAEKVQELKDKTAETTKDAYEKAKPQIDEAKQKASEAYDKAKKAVSGAIDDAKKAAEDAVSSPPAETPAEK